MLTGVRAPNGSERGVKGPHGSKRVHAGEGLTEVNFKYGGGSIFFREALPLSK